MTDAPRFLNCLRAVAKRTDADDEDVVVARGRTHRVAELLAQAIAQLFDSRGNLIERHRFFAPIALDDVESHSSSACACCDVLRLLRLRLRLLRVTFQTCDYTKKKSRRDRLGYMKRHLTVRRTRTDDGRTTGRQDDGRRTTDDDDG